MASCSGMCKLKRLSLSPSEVVPVKDITSPILSLLYLWTDIDTTVLATVEDILLLLIRWTKCANVLQEQIMTKGLIPHYLVTWDILFNHAKRVCKMLSDQNGSSGVSEYRKGKPLENQPPSVYGLKSTRQKLGWMKVTLILCLHYELVL